MTSSGRSVCHPSRRVSGSISVSLEPQGDEAVIEVTDTGVGIPDSDQPHLFEEFFRGSNVKDTDIPGTGLGLTIVKELVELYGGKMSVRSSLGHGTVVQVALPLAR